MHQSSLLIAWCKMADIKHNYMTISADVHDNGISMSCWMCPIDLWQSEIQQFPYAYTYMGDACTWVIHSNIELTNKAVSWACEEADRICIEQQKINNRRKVVNR